MATTELPSIKIALDKPIGPTGAHIDTKLARVTSLGIKLGMDHDGVGNWLSEALQEESWEEIEEKLTPLHDSADNVLAQLIRYAPHGTITTPEAHLRHEQQQIAWREKIVEVNKLLVLHPRLEALQTGTEGLVAEFTAAREALSIQGFEELARSGDALRRVQIERSLEYKKRLIIFHNSVKNRQKSSLPKALEAAEDALVTKGQYPDMHAVFDGWLPADVDTFVARAREYCRANTYYELEHHIILGARTYYQNSFEVSSEIRNQRIEMLSFAGMRVRVLQMDKWGSGMPLIAGRKIYGEARELVRFVSPAEKSRAKEFLQKVAQRVFLQGVEAATRVVRSTQAGTILYARNDLTHVEFSETVRNQHIRIIDHGLRAATLAIAIEKDMKWSRHAERWGGIFQDAWHEVQQAEKILWRYAFGPLIDSSEEK